MLEQLSVLSNAALLKSIRQWVASLPAERSEAISPDDFDELHDAVKLFRRWDASGIGGLKRKAVVGQLNEVRLARVRLSQRELEESVAVATTALSLAGSVRSSVVYDWLVRFHAALVERYAGEPPLREGEIVEPFHPGLDVLAGKGCGSQISGRRCVGVTTRRSLR